MTRTYLSLLLATVMTSQAFAATNDVIIQSRLDPKTTSWLIDKTRLVLGNVDIQDGLTATVPLPDDSLIPLSDLVATPEFRHIAQLVKQVFKIDVRNAALRLRIPKIYYHVAELHAQPTGLSVQDPTLLLETNATIRGFDINLLEGVQIDLMLLNPLSKKMESYLTGALKPVSVTIPSTLPPAEFSIALEATRDNGFVFHLKNYNLDKLPSYVTNHMNKLEIKMDANGGPLTANDISVNPVIVKLSDLRRSVQFDDFRPLVQKKLPTILGKVLTAVGQSLKKSIGPKILTQVFSHQTRGDLALTGVNIYSNFTAEQFSQTAPDQLAIDVAGDLCTRELFNEFKAACIEHVTPYVPVRQVPTTDLANARDEITAKLKDQNIDLTASISEEYINRVLQTTMDAKLWDDMLVTEHLKLGPKGAFMVFNETTSTPQLYLDLLYSGSGRGIESLVINERHPIRFPLRISTSVHFEAREASAVLVIKTEKLMSTADEIINGLPEYGLDSNLIRGLRRKIASSILKMTPKLENRTAVEIDLPLFRNVGLEKTWVEASAFGRINLYFKI